MFREPSIMCSGQCTERALSWRNEFPSEPAVHNRTLNIEAGVGPVVVYDVLIAMSATAYGDRRSRVALTASFPRLAGAAA